MSSEAILNKEFVHTLPLQNWLVLRIEDGPGVFEVAQVGPDTQVHFVHVGLKGSGNNKVIVF